MTVLACEVPTGAQAALSCGCVVATAQTYRTPLGQMTRAWRPWIVVEACGAHPGRERAIVEIGVSQPLRYTGVEPLQVCLP